MLKQIHILVLLIIMYKNLRLFLLKMTSLGFLMLIQVLPFLLLLILNSLIIHEIRYTSECDQMNLKMSLTLIETASFWCSKLSTKSDMLAFCFPVGWTLAKVYF